MIVCDNLSRAYSFSHVLTLPPSSIISYVMVFLLQACAAYELETSFQKLILRMLHALYLTTFVPIGTFPPVIT